MDKMKFNLTEILFPNDMTRSPKEIENVFQTEMGYDEIIVTRKDKQSISMSFSCTSRWVKIFKQFYLLDSFDFTSYDPILEREKTIVVRMTNYSERLVKNSWKVDTTVTQGLWEVSFTLEEL